MHLVLTPLLCLFALLFTCGAELLGKNPNGTESPASQSKFNDDGWLNRSAIPTNEFDWMRADLILKGELGKIAEKSAAFTEEEIQAGQKQECLVAASGQILDAWRNELAGMKADYRLERQKALDAAASVSPIDRMAANMKANFASDIRMAVWISTYDQVFVALGGTHYNPWAANAHDPGNAWQEVTFGEQLSTGLSLATLPLWFMPNPCKVTATRGGAASDDIVRLFHQGDLRGGQVSSTRPLSTSLSSDLSHYHPGATLNEFNVPKSTFNQWLDDPFKIEFKTDLHGPTGIITDEIRIYPPASGELNKYLVRPAGG